MTSETAINDVTINTTLTTTPRPSSSSCLLFPELFSGKTFMDVLCGIFVAAVGDKLAEFITTIVFVVLMVLAVVDCKSVDGLAGVSGVDVDINGGVGVFDDDGDGDVLDVGSCGAFDFNSSGKCFAVLKGSVNNSSLCIVYFTKMVKKARPRVYITIITYKMQFLLF